MTGINDLFTTSGAVFSDCQRYRYRLWRTWDSSKKPLVMVMLNPSIADAEQNDPTVERCQRRAFMRVSTAEVRPITVECFPLIDPGSAVEAERASREAVRLTTGEAEANGSVAASGDSGVRGK